MNLASARRAIRIVLLAMWIVSATQTVRNLSAQEKVILPAAAVPVFSADSKLVALVERPPTPPLPPAELFKLQGLGPVIRLYESTGGAAIEEYPHPVTGLRAMMLLNFSHAVSPDGGTLAGADFEVYLWDAKTKVARNLGTVLWAPEPAGKLRPGQRVDAGTGGGGGAGINLLTFSPDSKLLAASTGMECTLFDVATGARRLLTMNAHVRQSPGILMTNLREGESMISDLRFTRNGKQLVCSHWNGIFRVIDVDSGKRLREVARSRSR